MQPAVSMPMQDGHNQSTLHGARMPATVTQNGRYPMNQNINSSVPAAMNGNFDAHHMTFAGVPTSQALQMQIPQARLNDQQQMQTLPSDLPSQFQSYGGPFQQPQYMANHMYQGQTMGPAKMPQNTLQMNGEASVRNNLPPHPRPVNQQQSTQRVDVRQQGPFDHPMMNVYPNQNGRSSQPQYMNQANHPVNNKRRMDDEVVTIADSNSEADDETQSIYKAKSHAGTAKKARMNPSSASSITEPIVIDTSEEDLHVTKVAPKAEKESNRIVCIGRLEPVYALCFKIPNPGHLPEKLTHWPRMRIKIRDAQHDSSLIFILTDPVGNDFAKIDVTTARLLRKAIDITDRKLSLDKLELFMKRRLMTRGEEAGEAYPPGVNCKYALDLTFNLPKKYAAEVTGYAKRLELQFTDKGLRRAMNCGDQQEVNPDIEVWMPKAATTNPQQSDDSVEKEALNMISSFSTSGDLHEMEQPAIIASQLLDHQKKALYFMTEREKNPFTTVVEDRFKIWKPEIQDGKPVYYNKALDEAVPSIPTPTLGGIFADEMGMGKTLTTLSLIASTIDQSIKHSQRIPLMMKNGTQKPNLKATLIIVPKTLLEANWQKQIDTHMKPGSVNVMLFYGPERARKLDQFKDADIVITTYGTVEADARAMISRGGPLLPKANWFRIILDEAHTIRNQDTNRARACFVIEASRRWAVTGTPVQNHILDFGSICQFLRLSPFDTKARFQKYIEIPFRNGDPVVLSRLRIIVDTMTIRRTKDGLGLPEKVDDPVYIEMTAKERQIYDVLQENTYQQIKAMTRNRTKMAAGTMGHFLKKLGILRQFCAHKQDMLSQDDLKLLKGFTADAPIELDDDEDENVEMKVALDMLAILKECDRDNCDLCREKIQIVTDVAEDEAQESAIPADSIIGYMSACFHLICPKCKPKFVTEQNANKLPHDETHYACRTCDRIARVELVDLRYNAVRDFFRSREEMRCKPRMAKQLGTYTGPSSKVLYLLSNCRKFLEWNATNPEDKPMKAVVFTYWTTHLDLIEIALEDNGVKYARLDGRMGHRQRLAAIEQFEQDPETIIFLVSIGAGGVGLNLTAANFVFIMEPQWNPQAEQQAVDRVHRIGQTRPVRVARLIATDTIEDNIRNVGLRKLELARVTLTKKLGRKEERENKMKELQGLFKR